MKTPLQLLTSVGLALFWLQSANAQSSSQTNGYHQWWQDPPYGRPFDSAQVQHLPRIQVQGNKFVDPDGKAMLFRGVSIADPDKIEHEGIGTSTFFKQAMHGNVVGEPLRK